MRTILLISLLLASAPCFAQGFWPFDHASENLKFSEMQEISYEYKVILQNVKTKQNNDSMFGQLRYSNKRYVDSNTLFFTAKNGKQYCKLDHTDKTAIIVDLNELATKLKSKISDEPNKLIAISEEFFKDNENKIEYDYTNPLFFRVTVIPENHLLHFATIDFLKSDNSLFAAHFEIEDKDEFQNTWYRTIYYIYNVRNKVNENVFDLTRIFTTSNGAAKLNKKYSDYKLIKII